MITVKLVSGSTVTINLGDIQRVDGGTIYPGRSIVPETLIVLHNGQTFRAVYDELGNIVNALKAVGKL